MQHSPFSSILFLSGAFVSLLLTFGAKTHTGEQNTIVAADTATSVSLLTLDVLSCSLPAPTTFDGVRTSGTTASISWAAVTGASAYRLKVYNLNTSELVYDDTEYGTAKNLSGLDPGSTYRCMLASVCAGGAISEFVIVVDVL